MSARQILLPSILLVSSQVVASDLYFSLGTGIAWNSTERVTIDRPGQPDIVMPSLEFDTKPFDPPWYYNLRGGYMVGNNYAAELEFIHHKLYSADGLDSSVSRLDVTDGYNLFYANYAYHGMENWIARVGLGGVIAHPDVIIDGNRTHGGYQLAGPSVQAGLERLIGLTPHFSLGLEGKVTYAKAKFDIDEGEVTLPNTAIHILASIYFKP